MFVRLRDPSVLLDHVHKYKSVLSGKGRQSEIYTGPPEKTTYMLLFNVNSSFVWVFFIITI